MHFPEKWGNRFSQSFYPSSGFDISGHCFLLIYSMLLIAEECTSFRNWPSKPRVSVQHIPSRRDYERFKQSTKFIQVCSYNNDFTEILVFWLLA